MTNKLRLTHLRMIQAKVQRLELKKKYTLLSDEEKEELFEARKTLRMMKGRRK